MVQQKTIQILSRESHNKWSIAKQKTVKRSPETVTVNDRWHSRKQWKDLQGSEVMVDRIELIKSKKRTVWLGTTEVNTCPQCSWRPLDTSVSGDVKERRSKKCRRTVDLWPLIFPEQDSGYNVRSRQYRNINTEEKSLATKYKMPRNISAHMNSHYKTPKNLRFHYDKKL